MYSSQRVLFCTLIPKGQETEMMGLFTFVGQILGWIPPLIVTFMNESGVELRYGILVVTGFCFLAFICTLPMGDYEDAVARVTADSEEKLESVILKTKAGVPEKNQTHVDSQSEPSDGGEQSA